MCSLRTDPRSVLLVGASDERCETFRPALLAGAATDLVSVATLERARNVCEDRDDVGCVVVTDDVADATLVECRGEPFGYWTQIPVVALVGEGDETLAGRATAAGAAVYLPADADEQLLTDAVDDALETYERRRDAAADSSMFQTLLDDTVHLSVSEDGDERIAVDQRRVALDDEVDVGPIACSHVPEERTTATFRDVRVSELDVQ